MEQQQKLMEYRAQGTISRQSEWLQSKSLQAINAWQDVEKREPSYTVGALSSCLQELIRIHSDCSTQTNWKCKLTIEKKT